MRRTSLACIPLALAALGALLAIGCSQAEEGGLHGKLGPGTGGPDIDENQLVLHDWTDPDGKAIGSFEYDASQFMHYHPDPKDDSLHVVANVPIEVLAADLSDDGAIDNLAEDEVLMLMTRIIGRPDTPCRFQAALLARDEGYKIEDSGDRKNAKNLELHQVNLKNDKIGVHQRFYCWQLRKPFGIEINVFTADEAHQDWRQVFHVLNSVDKP